MSRQLCTWLKPGLMREQNNYATVADRRYSKSMAIASINPATGEKLKEFKPHDDAEIEKRLKQSVAAFERHRRQPFAKRAEMIMAVSSLLDQEKKELPRTIKLEMGNLFQDGGVEIEKFSRGPIFHAEKAERGFEEDPGQTRAGGPYVHSEPMG